MPAPAPHPVTPAPAAQVAAHGPTLGIIANPVSARDIRRVVANAGNLQITDRVNIVLRVLSSAAACGVTRALVMPDRGGIRALLERHLKRHAHQQHHLDDAHATTGTTHLYPHVEFLDMAPTSTVDDSFFATRLLLAAGVSAIVVLGGDGTHRAVARELVAAGSRVPIAGLSTGTNNAFPEMREPTIAGIAAGLFACGRLSVDEALVANKLVEVHIADPVRDDDRRDIAIVDAVITHDRSVGARALWKTGSLDAMYLAFAEPQAIGLSAIGGLLQPVGRREPGGLAVQLAAEGEPAALTLAAPIAPGMVRPVRIAHWQRMVAGTPLLATATAGTVALDGERELGFEPGQSVWMTLHENAFFSVDVACCMGVAADKGLLRDMTTAMPAPTLSPATT